VSDNVEKHIEIDIYIYTHVDEVLVLPGCDAV